MTLVEDGKTDLIPGRTSRQVEGPCNRGPEWDQLYIQLGQVDTDSQEAGGGWWVESY